MNTKVQVIWNYEGELFCETCDLVAEDAPVYLVDGTETGKIVKDLFTKSEVFFEDAAGLFVLDASWIVSIKKL